MDSLDPAFLRNGLLLFIVLVSSLCVHEFAHAWTAHKLGDDTAWNHGRVTMNPLAHIDLFGTILFPLFCIFVLQGTFFFGWAKPVPVNVTRFRHLRAGDFLTTVAGPFSNLLIAIGVSVIGGLAFRWWPAVGELVGLVIVVNVSLLVFNLLPIPPLDGGRVLRIATGMSWETFGRISNWSMLALLIALQVVPGLSKGLGLLMMVIAGPLVAIARWFGG